MAQQFIPNPYTAIWRVRSIRMEWADARAILRNDLPPQLFPTLAPQSIIRLFSSVHRTSDSLLKMDIRAAHEWSRLKAACL
jgi:hypothetical protein